MEIDTKDIRQTREEQLSGGNANPESIPFHNAQIPLQSVIITMPAEEELLADSPRGVAVIEPHISLEIDATPTSVPQQNEGMAAHYVRSAVQNARSNSKEPLGSEIITKLRENKEMTALSMPVPLQSEIITYEAGTIPTPPESVVLQMPLESEKITPPESVVIEMPLESEKITRTTVCEISPVQTDRREHELNEEAEQEDIFMQALYWTSRNDEGQSENETDPLESNRNESPQPCDDQTNASAIIYNPPMQKQEGETEVVKIGPILREFLKHRQPFDDDTVTPGKGAKDEEESRVFSPLFWPFAARPRPRSCSPLAWPFPARPESPSDRCESDDDTATFTAYQFTVYAEEAESSPAESDEGVKSHVANQAMVNGENKANDREKGIRSEGEKIRSITSSRHLSLERGSSRPNVKSIYNPLINTPLGVRQPEVAFPPRRISPTPKNLTLSADSSNEYPSQFPVTGRPRFSDNPHPVVVGRSGLGLSRGGRVADKLAGQRTHKQ